MADTAGLLDGMRIGFGYQVRKFISGSPLTLGGLEIDHEYRLGGWLAGDIVCHSIIEALLTANGLPSLEVLFTNEDEVGLQDPLVELSQTVSGLLKQRMSGIANVTVKIVMLEPDIDSYRKDMVVHLASALQIHPDKLTVNIEHNSDFEAVVKGEAAVAFANVLCLVNQVGDAKPRSVKQQVLPESASVPVTAEDSYALSDEELAGLPQRAKEFEIAVKTKLPPLPQAEPPQAGDTLIIYSDGACRGNPGPSSSGWVVLNSQGLLVSEGGSSLGQRTNNQAEYLAVKEVAIWVGQNLGHSFKLDFRLDSDLVVQQLSGNWKIKDSKLKQLAMETMNVMQGFDSFGFSYVPRAENKRADALANKVLDEEQAKPTKAKPPV